MSHLFAKLLTASLVIAAALMLGSASSRTLHAAPGIAQPRPAADAPDRLPGVGTLESTFIQGSGGASIRSLLRAAKDASGARAGSEEVLYSRTLTTLETDKARDAELPAPSSVSR